MRRYLRGEYGRRRAVRRFAWISLGLHAAACEGAPAPELAPSTDLVSRAARAARWFDVKEHWVALGLFASLGLVLLLALWDPRTGAQAIAPAALGLAIVIAGTVWCGAIIGVLTASWRAV